MIVELAHIHEALLGGGTDDDGGGNVCGDGRTSEREGDSGCDDGSGGGGAGGGRLGGGIGGGLGFIHDRHQPRGPEANPEAQGQTGPCTARAQMQLVTIIWLLEPEALHDDACSPPSKNRLGAGCRIGCAFTQRCLLQRVVLRKKGCGSCRRP